MGSAQRGPELDNFSRLAHPISLSEERSRQSHWAGAKNAPFVDENAVRHRARASVGPKNVARIRQAVNLDSPSRPPPANQHSATTRQRGTQCSLPVSAPSRRHVSASLGDDWRLSEPLAGTANAAPTHQPEGAPTPLRSRNGDRSTSAFDPSCRRRLTTDLVPQRELGPFASFTCSRRFTGSGSNSDSAAQHRDFWPVRTTRMNVARSHEKKVSTPARVCSFAPLRRIRSRCRCAALHDRGLRKIPTKPTTKLRPTCTRRLGRCVVDSLTIAIRFVEVEHARLLAGLTQDGNHHLGADPLGGALEMSIFHVTGHDSGRSRPSSAPLLLIAVPAAGTAPPHRRRRS